MWMPEIHSCAKLVSDNEQLKKRLRCLRKENAALQQQVAAHQEKEKVDALLKKYATTRNMEVQTDLPLRTSHKSTWQPLHVAQKKRTNSSEQDKAKVDQLMSMHGSLMKRYEREIRMNVQHVETITKLNLQINDLEQKLRKSQIQLQQAEAEKLQLVQKSNKAGKNSWKLGNEPHSEADLTDLLKELHVVRKEREKFSREARQLRSELKGLDHGFFDEIEDIKFALQQSVKLNKEYEKCLQKMSSQFGVPYPNPEQTMASTR